MLIICQQFLHLMPLPTVTGLLSNECPKLSPTPYVYNLSWDLKSRSADQSVLLDKFCKYKVNIIKFQLILCPQSTKTAGKNDPSTAEKKEQVLWNLKPLCHLCYTAWHTYVYMVYVSIYIYIYMYIYIYIMWYVYVDIYIYVYILCGMCTWIYIYISPPKVQLQHRFKQWQLSTGQNFGPNSQGSPRPLTHQKLGLGTETMKYWVGQGRDPKWMGLWNIPYIYNWVVVKSSKKNTK